MMQLLRIEILDWANPEKIKFYNCCNDGSKGCFLEAELDYPDNFHDLNNDYPLTQNKSHKRNVV